MTSTREPLVTRGARDSLADAHSCERRLAQADDTLVVTLDETPREWLTGFDATVRPSFVATYPHPDSVRTVADPGNLTTIAAAVADFLRTTPDAATPAVCVDTLGPIREYASDRATERWLAAVAGRVAAAGGTLHCHDCENTLPHGDLFFESAPGPEPGRRD